MGLEGYEFIDMIVFGSGTLKREVYCRGTKIGYATRMKLQDNTQGWSFNLPSCPLEIRRQLITEITSTPVKFKSTPENLGNAVDDILDNFNS